MKADQLRLESTMRMTMWMVAVRRENQNYAVEVLGLLFE